MRDARDAEDAFLLENGDHAALIAAYYDVVVDRCRIRVRTDAWYDVAQTVFERLLKELARGKRYPVPYRVVVHQVITWTIQGHFQDVPPETPLADDWDIADTNDPYRLLEDTQALDHLFSGLPDGSRRVLGLRYQDGLEIDEIAERLGLTRNAVDQALHRGHAKLREGIRAG
jgi:RNA polymerase sigma factor (sigma-70 family)